MAAASSASIIRVPGRLISNPTDLGAGPPYGGTYLGMSRDQEFIPRPILRPIRDEAWGSLRDVIYCGESVIFRAVLRYPDTDAVLVNAPKAISSGSSGVHWLFRPGGTTGNTRAGTSLGASSIKLMFAPRAPLAHQAIILYNAVPAIDEAARLQLSLGEEYGLACVYYGTPDASGRVYDTGLIANLVL